MLAPVVLHRRVDRVARGARDVGHDEPLLAEEAVHERRLADVRPADDGDAQRLRRLVVLLGETVRDLVEQVARARAVRRGDRNGVAGAEAVHVVEVRALRVVDLVRDEQPRLAGVAQQIDDARVARVRANLRVGHEDDEIGLADGLHHLLADLDVHRHRRVFDDAAGVDEPERLAVPLGAAEVTVARGARFLADDGGVRAEDAIEERRLADVGPADEGDDGDCHVVRLPATTARLRATARR
jgi:hypothetical protein